jgi:hypothetical protein
MGGAASLIPGGREVLKYGASGTAVGDRKTVLLFKGKPLRALENVAR